LAVRVTVRWRAGGSGRRRAKPGIHLSPAVRRQPGHLRRRAVRLELRRRRAHRHAAAGRGHRWQGAQAHRFDRGQHPEPHAMRTIHSNAFRGPARQTGISLLVVLILLLVTSVLGIAVLRSSAMQERMSGNMYDRSLAMQAAEIGLNAGEQALNAAPKWQVTVPVAQDCTDSGICPTYTKLADATWMTGPILGASDSN